MTGWQFGTLWQYQSIILYGAWMTFALTVCSALIGTLLGPCIGLLRMSSRRWLSLPAAIYVEAFRVTPTLVQLVWIYYALPVLVGFQMNAFTSVLVGLGMHEAAYIAEIFRAGVKSIDRGQFQAARAMGMSHSQAMRRIILPQAIKRMMPPLVNEFASLMKLTSLASVLAVPELLHTAYDIIATTFRPLEMYTTVALAYALVVAPFIIAAHFLENAWGKTS